MHHGWYQLAFERDLQPGLNPLSVEGLALLAVLTLQGGQARVAVYEGRCPHRGALLAEGGVFEGDQVRCPFHGYAVRLGSHESAALCVKAYPSLLISGLLFVKLDADTDAAVIAGDAFSRRMRALNDTHFIAAGFNRIIHAPAELIVENAFDGAHFQPVHQTLNQPRLREVALTDGGLAESGVYCVEGEFQLPATPWQGSRPVVVPFQAQAFSPTLVLSQLGGPRPYSILTATLPLSGGGCQVRLSVLIEAGAQGADESGMRILLRQAEAGIAKDQPIWERLADGGALRHAMPADDTVIGFRRFCEQFKFPAIRPALHAVNPCSAGARA